MNKIFKVIWSKARNCYVVVSEIAHCQGKGKGQKRAVLTCSLAAALTVFTLTGGVTAVQAETGTTAYAAGVEASATGNNATAVGNEAKASDENAMAVGNKAEASKKDAVAVGNGAKALAEDAMAIGNGANVGENGENAMAVGNKAEASKKDAVAVGNGAKALAEDAMAIGNGANVGEKGNASLAIGTGAQASGENDIVIGHNAKNESNQSDGLIVIGHEAAVSNNGSPKDSIAIGTSANVVGENNIAIGTNAAVTNNGGNNAISLGTEAKAEKSESIAIGMKAHANNNDGIAAIAIGSGSEAQKDKSIAIGYKALAENNGESGGIAIGSSIVDSQGNIITQTKAAQGNDIAFGVGAQTNNRNMNGHNGGAIAIGHLSYSNGNQDVAIGDNAKTGRHESEGEGYVAIGANSFSNVGPGVVGYDFKTNGSHNIQTNEDAAAWKSTNGAVSVGNVSDSDHTKWITRQITGVAAGSNNTDAVNVAQLKAAIDSVKPGGGSGTGGDGVHYYSVLSDETGDGSNYDNKGAKGKNSLAAGVSASATEKAENAVAIGYKAKAEGKGATVIGQYGTATGRYALAFGGQQTDTSSVAANNVASGDNSVAFGERSTASGSNSTAFGQETKATEKRATAFGQRTQATQSNATAFGIDTIASGQNATAFGERTVASGESATAFGSDSTAEGKNSLAFGEGSNALGGNSLAGLGGTAAADDSIALGRNAQARSKDTLAIGNGAKALTGKDVAIGYGAEASGNLTDTSTYNYPAIAIGDGTSVKASESVAIGKANVIERADGEADLAGANILGHNNTVKASGVAVIGNNNSVTDPRNHDVMILGNLVTKTTDNSVFLGSGSAYTSESESTKGKSKTYTSDRIGGATLTYAGGAVTSGIVSVGSPDATRRIQNVAPGLLTSASTDAVNGSQLYAVANVAAKNTEILGKGLKFKGDNDTVITKKLDEQLDIVGGADAKKLTDKNIGVNNVGGQLKIQLAKNIDLTKSGSVMIGDTTINNTGLTIQNGPSITKTHIDAGSKTIINVAPGKNGTDAVNVNQLNKVQNIASAHTTVSVGDRKAQKDGKEVKGGNLILTRTQDAATHAYNYDVKLGNDITVGEKDADGKDGKISVNGKDGSSVVINGKDGTIGLNGKNGTNGLTIRGAAGKPGVDGKDGITRIVYKDAAGKDHPVATLDDGLNFKGDDNTVIPKKLNQRMDIVGGANKNNLSENNIGVISDNGKLHVKLAKDLKDLTSVTTTDEKGNTTVQNDKGVTVKDSQNNTATFTAKYITFTNQDKSHKTKLDEDGLTIFTKGASGQSNQTIKITNTYISMGGQQIHNVSAGKADTDAVNVSQLKAVQSVAEAHSTVSVGGKKAGKDSVDVKGGNLVLKRTENTNGSKNYDVKLADDISIKSVTTTDDKGNKTVQKGGGITTIDKDGNKTSVTGKGVTTVDKDGNKTSLTGKGMTTVDKDGNKTSVTGKGVSISGKDGNKTTITEKGLTIKDGPVVTKDKFSAGGQQIHDVEAGTAPKDAVNVSQLKDEIGKVEQHHTEVTVNGGTEAKEGTYNPSGNLQIKKTTDKDTGKKTYDLKLADNLTFGAKDGSDGKEGVDGSIGVNGRNGSAVVINGQDGSIGLNGADGKNGLTIKGADGTVGVDGKAGTTRLIYETKDGETTVKHEVATMDDGMKYSGDSGNAAVKLNKNVQIYGGATEYADGNNIGVVASQDGDNAKLQVKLAKDLKGINSIEAKTITTGNTTIDNGGLTVKTGDSSHQDITIKQGNVNMGGNKIEGVAPGKVSQDSTDAVNGSQLWQRDQAINGLSGSVNKLGNRINRVGAGAAALAALHPLDFDPDDKWDFAAGYGNYRGANAAAVGAYYRPNEDTMFSVGGSFGGGENMVNAGVSIKLGQGNHVSTSRVAMAKEIKDLRQNVANLNAIVNRQSALIDKLTGTNAGMIKDKGNDLFPDVPANHWAYEYVTKLKHAGILTGYPDGNFDGDRMMTRYEFAAIVYRAIMAGAASNPALNQDGTLDKLANEFSSEMKYIRIDTIAKDKNGKPTIERVRVISDAK